MLEHPTPPPQLPAQETHCTVDKKQAVAPSLTLYMRKSCPCCQKVLTYLEQAGKTLPLADADQNVEVVQTVIEIGGKRQFPCLVIDGEPLYESQDIINWLKNNPDAY